MRTKIKRVPQSGLVVKDAFCEFVGYQTARGMADSTMKTYHNHFHIIAKYFDIKVCL